MIAGLGEAMMLTMAKNSLRIENEIETQESSTIYVPVPEFSDERNIHVA